MKGKKSVFFSPIIFLSLFLIVFISFIHRSFSEGRLIALLPLIFSRSPIRQLANTKPPISPKKSSFFSLLTSHPAPDLQPLTSLVAVGDIMLGRYCNVQMLQKNDWQYPFSKVADFTKNADISFGNLEAPIIENCPTTDTGMIFCARPESIAGLKSGGFDVLSVSNNHALNQGQNGLSQTKLLLEKNGISFSDSNKPIIKNINGIKFGFVSFDLVTYPKASLIPQISPISPTVDILIVSLHWGNEYQKTPTAQQKELAHQIIDAGAKIITGHHPHVTQPTESYHNGLIFYSLGNFVFDQPWSEETKKGNIAKILFEGKEIKSYEIIPVYIQNYCQPQLLSQ